MNDGRTSAVTFVFGFFFRLVNTRRNGVPFEIILFIHHHMERNQWAILEVIRWDTGKKVENHWSKHSCSFRCMYKLSKLINTVSCFQKLWRGGAAKRRRLKNFKDLSSIQFIETTSKSGNSTHPRRSPTLTVNGCDLTLLTRAQASEPVYNNLMNSSRWSSTMFALRCSNVQ